MKLIIDLPEEDFGWNGILNICRCSFERLIQIVSEGTPLEEIEPCDDAISRQAVAEVLLKYAHSAEGKAFAEFLISQINDLPPVTPQPKMGEWYLDDEWRCSVCNCVCEDWRGIPTYKYCPQCGSYVGKRQEVSK